MEPFRIALSGDFRKPDGSPTFPSFDLAPITGKPGALQRTSQQVQAGGDVAKHASAKFQRLLALQDLAYQAQPGA